MAAGVNVAAFLLMDSQKGSTSPGHKSPAGPNEGEKDCTSDGAQC